ncbi:hypothetical protein BH24PSE2_BH24PSE2_07110 [soil metagenome]
MRTTSCTAILGTVLLGACAPPDTGDAASASDTGLAADGADAIAERSAAWEEAFNNGDLEALVALYADDARILSPEDAMAEGHAAVESAFRPPIDAGATIDLQQVEIDAAGELGYQVGTFTDRSADGKSQGSGKFIEIWRRTDSEWKIVNDIWNTDPSPESGTANLLMITHEVEDSERWMNAWRGPDGRRELFKKHGVTEVTAFHDPETPERKALLIEVDDMDAWQTFIDSEESKSGKAEDTVIDESMRTLVPVE